MGFIKVVLSVIVVALVLLFVVVAVKGIPSIVFDDISDNPLIAFDDDTNSVIDYVNDIINNDVQQVILLKNEDLTDVQSCIYKFDTGSNIVTARCDGYTDEYIPDTPVCHQLRHDSIDDYFKYIFNEHICGQMGLYWHANDINQGCYYTIDLVDDDMKPIDFNFVAGIAYYSDTSRSFKTSDYYFDAETNRICIIPDAVVDNDGEIVHYKVNAFLNTEKSLS